VPALLRPYLTLGLFLLLGSQLAQAENFTLDKGESLPRTEVSEEFHSTIEEVLTSDDFARKKIVNRWRLKSIEDLQKEQELDPSFPEWIIDLVRFFEGTTGFFAGLAKVFEVLLWALLIGVIIYILLRYRTQIEGFFSSMGQSEPEVELPVTMFGLDVQKTSLPEDVVGEAKADWSRGDYRQAIAVLLRASLIKLLHDHDCRFLDSDTESECCEKIDDQASASLSKYMRGLVSAWQQIAYAHKKPNDANFDQLCAQWREVF